MTEKRLYSQEEAAANILEFIPNLKVIFECSTQFTMLFNQWHYKYKSAARIFNPSPEELIGAYARQCSYVKMDKEPTPGALSLYTYPVVGDEEYIDYNSVVATYMGCSTGSENDIVEQWLMTHSGPIGIMFIDENGVRGMWTHDTREVHLPVQQLSQHNTLQ